MEHTLKLRSFQTPNFVVVDMPPALRQDGMKGALSFPLSEIKTDTLSDLCDEFRANVFEKAGKKDPRK